MNLNNREKQIIQYALGFLQANWDDELAHDMREKLEVSDQEVSALNCKFIRKIGG